MIDKEVLNFEDVVAMIGKSKPTIWRWMKAGVFPNPMRVENCFLGWRKSTILDWLDTCEQEAA